MAVQRLICGVKRVDGYLQPFMSPNPQGGYVSYEDYEETASTLEELQEGLKQQIAELEDPALRALLGAGFETELDAAQRLKQLLPVTGEEGG